MITEGGTVQRTSRRRVPNAIGLNIEDIIDLIDRKLKHLLKQTAGLNPRQIHPMKSFLRAHAWEALEYYTTVFFCRGKRWVYSFSLCNGPTFFPTWRVQGINESPFLLSHSPLKSLDTLYCIQMLLECIGAQSIALSRVLSWDATVVRKYQSQREQCLSWFVSAIRNLANLNTMDPMQRKGKSISCCE